MNVPAFATWENLTQLVAEGLPDGVVEGDGGSLKEDDNTCLYGEVLCNFLFHP